jgi:hypothetical protein
VSTYRVFFVAADVRYCVSATSVAEIARLPPRQETLRGHLPVSEFGTHLGAVPTGNSESVIVFEGEQTWAARVDDVIGAYDSVACGRPPSNARLQKLLSPYAEALLIHQASLWVELTAQAIGHKPQLVEPPEWRFGAPSNEALTLTSGGDKYAVPFSSVVQVVLLERHFTWLPSVHRRAGALHFRERAVALCGPNLRGIPRWAVLVDAGGETVGLVADAVGQVEKGLQADDARFIDVPVTFS